MKQSTASSSKRIPKLRFPEFKDAPEWNEEKFAELYSLKGTNTLSRDKLNYDSGLVKNIHYGDIHTKFSTLFRVEKEDVPFINPSESLQKIKKENYCQVGDMVFADASEDLEDVGKSIEITSLNGEKVVSGLHTILARQKGKRLISGFGGHLFKSKRLREQIQREAQGAKVLGISGGRLSNIDVGFPADESEQQRIADCLSSLDKWIEAEAKQLDALKEHKKGLMQQLFPAEGETTPKLRFPEFQDAPEWEEKYLGQICETTTGRLDANAMVSSGKYRFYTCAKDYYRIDTYAFDTDALLISGNGANVGYIHHYKGKFNAYQRTYVLDQFTENIIFVKYLLECSLSCRIALEKKDGNTPYIVRSTLTDMAIRLPHPEEQKLVATCLSELDKWISSQGKRVEALYDYKAGLMQQLFPSSKEGNA